MPGDDDAAHMNVQLYVWQRATAALLAPLVLVHLAVIFYASRQSLSAADILSRTHGSMVWAAFYGLFVAAASIHASIGLRNILSEWSPLADRAAGWSAIGFGIVLAFLGFHAVVALVLM
jgi:fumarate reductase subunit C